MLVFVGDQVVSFFRVAGEITLLWFKALKEFLWELVHGRVRFKLTLDYMYTLGVESAPLVLFSMAVVSLMSVLEFSFHMKLVLRQDSLVPAFSTVLMVRELAPVVTAMLLASRVGASIAAEIGAMKITDQLEQLKLLGISFVEFGVVPRVLACIFAAVTLNILSIGVAVFTSVTLSAPILRYGAEEFFNTMFLFTRFEDLIGGLMKSVVFGILIAIVGSYEGLHCGEGSQGVGTAATRSVVKSSMLVIAFDFLLTYCLYAL